MTTEYMIPTRPQYITFESTGTGDAKRYLDEKMSLARLARKDSL
jgi:hypothetical protein